MVKQLISETTSYQFVIDAKFTDSPGYVRQVKAHIGDRVNVSLSIT